LTYPTGTRRRRSRYTRALKRRKTLWLLLLACVPLLIGVYGLSLRVASWSSARSAARLQAELRAELPGNDMSDLAGDSGKDLGALDTAAPKNANAEPHQNAKHGRLVYPYSVVPGGVQTPEELAEAAKHDPDVALHYSRLNFRQARLVRLVADERMYISYRKGGRILWTKKPHLIRAGETVITDGKVTARTRCGNRLAAKPKGITEADEPSESQLDRPVAMADAPMRPPVTALDDVSPLVASSSTPQGPLGEPVWRSPLQGGGGGGGRCPIDPETHKCKKKKHHHPPTVPEPGTLVLVGSGILMVGRKYLTMLWKS